MRAYRTALVSAPDDVDGWRELARALQSLHDVPGTIAAWQRVVALAPLDWEAQNDLGAALMERGDWEGAEAAFAAARLTAPNEPIVTVNLATLDVRRGRAADAVSALEACSARHPDFAPAHAGLGFALRERGRFDDAAAALRRALTLSPDDSTFACGLSRALLEAGSAAEASSVARDFLERRPGHAGALAAEALARMALGDARAVERLLDHERFVARIELKTPEGYTDISAFNRALAEHVSKHPTLLRAPTSHATKDGLHSGSLLVSPRGPVAGFEQALRSAVASYWRTLPELADHPFTQGRPKAAYFNLWGVVLEKGGHQTPHIHPSAWLSGVYYARVPEAIGSEAPKGWLEFGGADCPFPSLSEPRVLRVRPVEGLLVLFPSYFYHRTIPFEGSGTRISIAFDLVPATTRELRA